MTATLALEAHWDPAVDLYSLPLMVRVGARAARPFRLFRYEIRRWRDGLILDAEEAVESPAA